MPVGSDRRWYSDAEAINRGGESRTNLNAATTNGTPFRVEGFDAFTAMLTVTSEDVNGTLDVKLQTRVGAGGWYDVGAFSQKSEAGSDEAVFGPLGDECRWVMAVGGGGQYDFTIAVKGRRRTG